MLNTTINNEYAFIKAANMEKKALSYKKLLSALMRLDAKAMEASRMNSPILPNIIEDTSRYTRLNKANDMRNAMNESKNSLLSMFFRPSTASLADDAALALPGRFDSASLKNLAKGVINDNILSDATRAAELNNLARGGNYNAASVLNAASGKFPSVSALGI